MSNPNEVPTGWHRHPNGGGLVQDTATVSESVYVGPNARVGGDAWVGGSAQVYGHAWVCGHARVDGYAWVGNYALVSGYAWVCGDARIGDSAEIVYGLHTTTPLYIHGTKHPLTYSGDGMLTIGCHTLPITEWLKRYREIGADEQYTEAQIEEYGRYIKLAAEMYGKGTP